MDRGELFVISAPSGAGKTTLCNRLIKELSGLEFSVSHTTRTPRPNEVHGKDYFFVSHDEFQRLVQKDAFLEWARVHGNFYGTSKEQVVTKLSRGIDVVLDIDVQGARQVKERFPGAITIFILPPSWKVLEKRLKSRGSEDREKLRIRLQNALKELEEVTNYDYVVVNDKLDVATEELKSIVVAARLKAKRVLTTRIDLEQLKPDPSSWFLLE